MPKQKNINAIVDKAKDVHLVLTDIDGILTNGQLYYGLKGEVLKTFHVHDGIGIKLLQSHHIPVAILTGSTSNIIMKRMQELQVQHIFQGLEEKLLTYEALLKELKLSDNEVAYLGDDIADLPILERVGLSITVSDAPSIIQSAVDWCTSAQGGHGAFREAADLILKAKM